MSIVATEIEFDDAPAGSVKRRTLFYRCQDSQGVWHSYGPVHTMDQAFDAEGYKTVVAEKVAESLAKTEAREVIG